MMVEIELKRKRKRAHARQLGFPSCLFVSSLCMVVAALAGGGGEGEGREEGDMVGAGLRCVRRGEGG